MHHDDVRLDILGRPIPRAHASSRGLQAYDLEFDDTTLPRKPRPAPDPSLPGIPPPRRAPTLEEIAARKQVDGALHVVVAFYALFGAGALVLLICGAACMASGGSGPTCGSGLGGGVAMAVMGVFIAFRLFVVWRKFRKRSDDASAARRHRANRYSRNDEDDEL